MSDDHDPRRDDASFPPPHDPEHDPGDGPPRGAEPPPPPPPPPAVGGLPPWEDRDRYTFLSGFFATVAQAVTSPSRFFTGMPTDRGLLGPISFALVMGVLSAVASWIWSNVFSSMELGMLAMFEELGDDAVLDLATLQMLETVAVFLSPVFALINLFIYAGIFHLGLMLTAPDRRGFEATLRAVAYGGSAYVLALVPMCGEMLMTIWAAVLWMIGINRLHGCGGGRAVLVVLAPLVLSFCGCAGLGVMIAALTS